MNLYPFFRRLEIGFVTSARSGKKWLSCCRASKSDHTSFTDVGGDKCFRAVILPWFGETPLSLTTYPQHPTLCSIAIFAWLNFMFLFSNLRNISSHVLPRGLFIVHSLKYLAAEGCSWSSRVEEGLICQSPLTWTSPPSSSASPARWTRSILTALDWGGPENTIFNVHAGEAGCWGRYAGDDLMQCQKFVRATNKEPM